MPRTTPKTKTFVVPDTTDRFGVLGNPPDGYIMVFSGVDGYWLPKPHSNVLAISSPSSSPYNATALDEVILVHNAGGVFVVNLPAAPPNGTAIYIKDFNGNAAANNINVTSGSNIDGTSPYAIATNFGSIRVVWNGATWSVLTKF